MTDLTPTRRVRLADVADRAGVSEATVSRVLNGKPGVGPVNRRAVMFALEELGYRREPRGRSRTAGLVGLVVPELDNPSFPVFAQAVETALAHRGYVTVLCTITADGAHEDDYVEMLRERRVEGIVFVSGGHANTADDLRRYHDLRADGVPIVLVNGYRAGIDAPFLSPDDGAGVQQAVEHLADLGHVRIGLAIGPERYVPVQRKVAAFAVSMRRRFGPAALRAAGWEDVDGAVAYSVFDLEGGRLATERLLDRGASAVLAGSDVMALGAIRAARDRGLDVPEDLSVVGSDGITFGEFLDPPLTTVRPPMADIAEAATRALLEEIGGHPMPRAEYLFRPELVVRASTGPPRATEPDVVLTGARI